MSARRKLTPAVAAPPRHAHAEAAFPVLVCIGVCTAGRPRLLAKCLASLVRQPAPPGHRYCFIIVDNESKPAVRQIVEAASVHSRHAMRYEHEPRRGISFARNRALQKALALGAQWVGFIDDDETAAPEWLARLLEAARRYDAEVIHGPVMPRYPDPRPFWALLPPSELADGDETKFAATGNVLFAASLIRSDGLGLRFDEAMALTGGEDTDFFLRAKMRGVRIVYSADAVAYEEIAPERLTFARQMKLAFRNGANDVYIKRKHYGTGRILLRRLPQSPLRLARGILLIAVSPALAAFGAERFKTAALAGGRLLFKTLGVLAGLVWLRPKPYRQDRRLLRLVALHQRTLCEPSQ